MERFFSNSAFNFSATATLGIACLFYCFSQHTVKQCANTSTQVQITDLSDFTDPQSGCTAIVFDSVKIGERSIPDFNRAMRLLKNELRSCKTDTDSIDVCAAFVCRIFDFGGTHNPQFPGEKWADFSLEEMYKYAQYDSGGIYCGQRTRALEKLLQLVGFPDMIEYSLKAVHTFLLVRTKQNKPWIADGYGLWGITCNERRTDFLTYIKVAKQKPEHVKCIQLPALFGLPEDLLTDEVAGRIRNKNTIAYLDSTAANPFCDTCKSKNISGWVADYLFVTEDTSKFKFKLVVKRNFADWADKKITGRNAITLWLAPDSVAQADVCVVRGTDASWANNMINEIRAIRKN